MTSINACGFRFVQSLEEEISSGTVELPSFPDIPFRIKKALDDPDITAREVAQIVATDPVFSARILNVANSAALARVSGPISDIPNAVTRIGFRMAHAVAMSVAMSQVMQDAPVGKVRDRLTRLWRHSLSVAALSYLIAKSRRAWNPDEAMLAGLMHDIGKVYIFSRAHKEYGELIDDDMILDAIVTQWHGGIGEAILLNWGFSPAMAQVASEHDCLERDGEQVDLTDVVLVANLFDYALLDGVDLEETLVEQWRVLPAFGRLDLTASDIQELATGSREEMQAITAALGS